MILLNLKESTISEFSMALSNHQITNTIDDDGDLAVSKNGNYSVLKIDDDKIKFFGILEFDPKYNIDHLTLFINKINYIGDELRFTVMSADETDGVKIFYSTAFIRSGFIDETYLCSTIETCYEEMQRLITLFPSMEELLAGKEDI